MSTTPIPPKQPTITSANIPKISQAAAPPLPVQDIPTAQLPVHDTLTIVARPLNDPDFASLRPKNPMHKLYWANRGHQNGFRVNYRVAQGFRLARKEDVANLPLNEDGSCSMVDPSGQITNGDLVLMIIGRNAYEGALLHNHNTAIRRGNKFGQVHQNWKDDGQGNLVPVENPTDVVRSTIDEVRASSHQKQKIRSFIPGQAEIDGLLADSKEVKP